MLNAVKPIERKSLSSGGFMQVDTLDAARKCAEIISKSAFCPKGMIGKPDDILVALQLGQELGLKPMQALQNIAVVNGRPSVWGDAMLAICRQSPDFEYITEEYIKETNECVCKVKRKYEPECVRSFSEEDARKANLWGKEGTWKLYPKRMLQMRARSFAFRDTFTDELRGIYTEEEASDITTARVDYSNGRVGTTIEGQAVQNDVISADQLEVLERLIDESGSKEEDICQYLKIDTLENMKPSKWAGVCGILQKKITKKQSLEALEINQALKLNETKEDVNIPTDACLIGGQLS